jgi:eukaryotic-like serine/threonine-protein kinase
MSEREAEPAGDDPMTVGLPAVPSDRAMHNPVERLAAEFGRRCRDGDDPSVEEYALLHPELAGEIRELFPVVKMMERCTGSGAVPAPPGQAGQYRLLRQIGEGGMGLVYEAEQARPRRRVALKLIKPGMDTKQIIARFEAERQALALMNHPNIARVFDAGATPDGRPYFVMEYVKGEPICAYCDRHRLTVRQRLELFARVCDAVQHAHMKGVIHRDLKPSNILVAVAEHGAPRPVIIDFGIAKAVSQALTDTTVYTAIGQLMGTPEYMSPEQAEMSETDVDTRTDIYSLGVILYELLTGALPFDRATLRAAGRDAIHKMIREVDPPRPATRLSQMGDAGTRAADARRSRLEGLAQLLRSELEWIPLKAMRKDRSKRYRSAAEMGDDVGNYLAHRPLLAAPESIGYQLRKLLRRHRGEAAAAAAILVALLAGLAGTLWQSYRASERADAATKAELEQRRLAQSEASAKAVAVAKAAEADEARKDAELEAYIANLTAADSSLIANEPQRVRARLDACPRHLRGWEWRWLQGRCDGSILHLGGHPHHVSWAAFDAGGTRIVTACADGILRVWDAATGEQLRALRGHHGPVYCAAFDGSGRFIVSASFDRTARIWDAAGGAPISTLRGHDREVWTSAFSADGRRVVTASADQSMRVWDVAQSKEVAVLRGHQGAVLSAAFSPDGTRVVSASADNTARIWEVAAASEVAVLRGHEKAVNSATFSPDGGSVVTASSDRTARLWDAGSGREVAVLRGHTDLVYNAAFSADGKSIVTGSEDGTARIWRAAGGKELAVLRGHLGGMRTAAFSPDGARVVTASRDRVAQVWDAAGVGNAALLRGHQNEVYSAAFSADGNRIVTASWDGTARVWDVASGRRLAAFRGHEGGTRSGAFSPDGRRVVTASWDGTARLWDATSGNELTVFRGHEGGVLSAGFDRDGGRVVTASSDNTARVWDAASGRGVAVIRGHRGMVFSAAFSPDGGRIITASADHTARLWDAASGSGGTVFRGHEASVFSAAFSRDGGRIVTASWDKTARVWDVSNGVQLAVLRGHEDAVWDAAFSPDGRRIVTASHDETARIWDADSGKELAVLRGHERAVASAAFSPDGTRIVTASYDHTARLWDSVPFRERYPEVAAARAAEAKMTPLVRAKLVSGQTVETAAQAIDDDGSLSLAERTAARAELHGLRWTEGASVVDRRKLAQELNTAAWVAAGASATPDRTTQAVAKARRAVELVPENAVVLGTFGVALYRAGQFEACLDALTRSLSASEGALPAERAAAAMAQWKLHQFDEARASLEQLRALATTERWKGDEETVRWVREAEGLIGQRAP